MAGPGATELGISGTTNFSGDLQVEINAALMRQAGYGIPGARNWGAWETLSHTDPDCATALDKTMAPLRDSRLNVKAAVHERLPEAEAKRHAEFVEWAFANASPRWADLSQRLAHGALVYGFSLNEKVYADCEHSALPGGRGVTIVRFAERLPQSLHSAGPWIEKTEPNGEVELDYVRQTGLRGGRWDHDIKIPAKKLLLVSWNRRGNNYAGFSVFRPVWYHTRVREMILKIVAIGAQREGLGMPVAESTGPDAADLTPQQRQDFTTLLMATTFHENAALVPPKGWKVEWSYSPSRDKTHLVDLYNALGVLILRTLSAQQVALGTGETGSRSVGQVHNAVANEFVQGVVSVLEGALAGVAKELTELNFGPQPAYPLPTITLKRSQLGAGEIATSAKAGVEVGLLTVLIKDENAFREALGWESITEEERDEAQAKKRANAPPVPPPFGGPQTPPAPMPSPPAPSLPPAKAKASSAFVPRRPLRASEQHLDLSGMSNFLDGAKDRFERGAKPLVAEMLTKALPAVRLAMADGDPSELATVTLDAKRLDAFVAEFLRAAWDEGRRQVRAEVLRGTPPPERVTAAAGGEVEPPLLKAQRAQVVRRIATRLGLDLEARAVDVVRTGGDASEVISEALSDLADSASLRGDAGLLTTKAWNGGRDDAARELGGISEVELSAVLDTGTCAACEALDGTRYDFESAEHDAHVPPLRECEGRDNCRCLLAFIPAPGGGE